MTSPPRNHSARPTPPAPKASAKAAGDAAALQRRYAGALARRHSWHSHWQDCYDLALPQGPTLNRHATPGARRVDRLFDGTAPDAVDQLAASLLAQLTPPWSRWFGLAPGSALSPAERDQIAPALERVAATVQAHFDHSNFAVELHQSFLDLVTVGTASLLFEENAPGETSGFRFTAVPLAEAVLEEGVSGRLDTTFRRVELTLEELQARFPNLSLPDGVRRRGQDEPEQRFGVLEAVVPEGPLWRYSVILEDPDGDGGADGDTGGGGGTVIAHGRFGSSPYLNFRWQKTPGETYGRSPVMKALPDIKTANKVVELVLKNASIAVTGMWQADDDGVLNPATIRLVPGAIIPKAVGSAGLTALANPARFDVSQLVLDDLRRRIRHALLVDRLGQIDDQRMTATEVLERSAEMARLLGATYGRLQSELLTPLVQRALAILRRRGEIPDLAVDGRLVALHYRSPLAQAQASRDIDNTLRWLEAVSGLGEAALAAVDLGATARWLGEALAVPPALMRTPEASDTPQTATAAPAQNTDASAGNALGQALVQALSQPLNQAAGQVSGPTGGVSEVVSTTTTPSPVATPGSPRPASPHQTSHPQPR